MKYESLKSIFGLVVVVLAIGFATYSHLNHKAKKSEYNSLAMLNEKEIVELKELISVRDNRIQSLKFQFNSSSDRNSEAKQASIPRAEKRANGKLLEQIADQRRDELLLVAEKDKQISALTMEVMTLKIELLEGSNETDYINRELLKQLQKEEAELQRKAGSNEN